MLSAFLLFNAKNWNLFSPEYQSPSCQVRREKSQNVHCFWRWRAVGAWGQWGKTRVLIIESLPLAEPHAKSTRIVTSFSRPKKKKSVGKSETDALSEQTLTAHHAACCYSRGWKSGQAERWTGGGGPSAQIWCGGAQGKPEEGPLPRLWGWGVGFEKASWRRRLSS